MNNYQNYQLKSAARKPNFFVLMCLLTLASLCFSSCENKGKGDTTTHNDTSSAVTKTVDTAATDSGTKQP